MNATEYESEPVPGLPGHLPPGERLLWQGSPDRATLARTAFHTRLAAGYFALLAAIAAISGSLVGLTMTVTLGVAGFALLHLLAWWSARTTLYTLTDRRIVLRVGMALPTCVNLPLSKVASADLALHAAGHGDVALTLTERALSYPTLWPHVRAWRLAKPEPMLRSIPDAARVGALIARTCLAAHPVGRIALPVAPAAEPVASYGAAVAA